MRHRTARSTAVAVAAVVLTGCASTGVMRSGNLTNVELGEGNYRIVATDVGGVAEAGYLIGLSAAIGAEMRTIALARVSGTGLLYQEALENLWANFAAEHGPVAGRSLALVNVRYDFDALNLLVYTRPRVSVRADVIEFVP